MLQYKYLLIHSYPYILFFYSNHYLNNKWIHQIFFRVFLIFLYASNFKGDFFFGLGERHTTTNLYLCPYSFYGLWSLSGYYSSYYSSPYSPSSSEGFTYFYYSSYGFSQISTDLIRCISILRFLQASLAFLTP